MKRVVWHEAFVEILKTLEQYAKTGWYFTGCADRVPRWLFPVILLLSADYEEQYCVSLPHVHAALLIQYCSRCIMALIRGAKGHFPCPICLIPREKLSDLSISYPLRTTETMRAVYETANEANTAAEKEIILKGSSLRDVKVCPWN